MHEENAIYLKKQGAGAGTSGGDQSEAGWLPQFSYSEAAIGADVYHADVVILDVMDGAVADQVLELCRTLRGNSAAIRLLLLVRQDHPQVRAMAVDAKQTGLADDFVFYDSSLAYLFAKLAAF